MKSIFKKAAVSALTLAVAQAALAGTEPYFVPLTQSSAVAAPNHINELNSPWQVPAGITYRQLTSMREIEADVNQSIQRVPGQATSTTMWDMLAYDPTGRYLFIPHETPVGAGISRYSIDDDTSTLIFAGDQQGAGPDGIRGTKDDQWANDFGAFDPARWTPWGTVIAAEEWSGLGRVVEIMDPWTSPNDPVAGGTELVEGRDWRVLTSIASVSHEGINFSYTQPNRVLYYIDEDNSGAIYKLVLKTPGDIAAGGQTFALVGDGFKGDPVENWNSGANSTKAIQDSRFGTAKWVPITGLNGEALPGVPSPFGPSVLNCGPNNPADPCRNEDIRPGRVAADAVKALPFGRPEDMSIALNQYGQQVLYVATTSENAVISIETNSHSDRAIVRSFASRSTPKNLGFAPTTGVLNAPDNTAVDALGNIYIIEDSPNDSDIGGDIWFARDVDNDGVAESLDHFVSIQVDGSEATGMQFDPRQGNKFVVAVQHPDSVDLERDLNKDGKPDLACATSTPHACQGDAIWEFEIKPVRLPNAAKTAADLKKSWTRATAP